MKRNYGIDCLRIISMFMVVVLHVLGQGGILANTEPLSFKYWMSWFLEIACYCCVNCFALISGYVMHQSAAKPSKILKVWFQTVFYTILAVIVFLIFKTDAVGKSTVVYAVFPIASMQYWYISAYFGMLILVPLLNIVLQHTEEMQLKRILISALVVFCALPTALRQNPYGLNAGYSMIWLSILYLVGGCIHKYGIDKKIKSVYIGGVVLAMLGITFLIKFVIEMFLPDVPIIPFFKDVLICFTSPTIVLLSIGLLILFSRLAIPSSIVRFVRFISPATLGVYLWHVNPLVWKHWMADLFAGFVKHNCIILFLLIMAASVGIFAIGIGLDLIRIKLYDLLKIDKLCATISTRICAGVKIKTK